jgi:ClpP class serine protease
LKEVLYAADRNFLERYLKEKSSASLDDMKAAADLWGKPIPEDREAVDAIYRVDGDTAYIAVSGPLSIEGPDFWDLIFGYGGTSYKAIQGAIDRARDDDGVKSVVFDVDSPGGTVAGVDETWQKHKALSAEKPTEVRAGSRLASAAYWISTPATTVLAASPTSEIGSIGVLVATYDWSKWEESIGIKEIVITSSKAPDKAPDVSTKHGRDTIRAQLDAIERIFYARICEGRSVSTDHIAEHFGRGGLLVARDPSPDHEDAIRARMIDGLTINALTLSSEGTNIPALAGKKQEGQTMSLSELLAANPAAAAEVEALKAKARAEGRDEAGAEHKALVAKCMTVLGGTSYPQQIREIAGKVLSGESPSAALEAAQVVYDAQIEAVKAAAAQDETAALGAVSADRPDGQSPEQKAVDQAWAASIAAAKERRERAEKEVKHG